MLPLIIAGSLVAVISGFLASGALSRASYVVAGAGLAGVAATAVLQSWLDVVGGDWAANAATLSLTVLATAAFIAGLQALLGQPGMILGALTMAFAGNLLLSTGYFDGAAAGGHVAVLVRRVPSRRRERLCRAARPRAPQQEHGRPAPPRHRGVTRDRLPDHAPAHSAYRRERCLARSRRTPPARLAGGWRNQHE